jgi:hypothetical protein
VASSSNIIYLRHSSRHFHGHGKIRGQQFPFKRRPLPTNGVQRDHNCYSCNDVQHSFSYQRRAAPKIRLKQSRFRESSGIAPGICFWENLGYWGLCLEQSPFLVWQIHRSTAFLWEIVKVRPGMQCSLYRSSGFAHVPQKSTQRGPYRKIGFRRSPTRMIRVFPKDPKAVRSKEDPRVSPKS